MADINKGKLLNDLSNMKSALEWDHPLDYQRILDDSIAFITDSEPTINAKWELKDAGTLFYYKYICSNCHGNYIGDKTYAYCPYCGAKMKGCE